MHRQDESPPARREQARRRSSTSSRSDDGGRRRTRRRRERSRSRERSRDHGRGPRGYGDGSRRDRDHDIDRDRQRKRDIDRARRGRSRSPVISPAVSGRGPKDERRAALPSQAVSFAATTQKSTEVAPPGETVEKQAPNFAATGVLAAETNTVAGIVLKYHEPPEARKAPAKDGWRLYVFKGAHLLETVELGPRSCWLVGRERTVVDFPVDHPSCSKQHAVIQFRFVTKTNEFGDREAGVRPYIIDLDSANGTVVNDQSIPASRYVELRHKDLVKFGLSSREYVLMMDQTTS